jgi:hypothetical protein
MSLASVAVKNPMFQKVAFETLKSQFEDDDEEAQAATAQSKRFVDNAVLDVDENELAKIQKWSKVLRTSMLVIATLVMITAYYNFASTSTTLSSGFLAMYLLFFSCMLCCFEIAYKSVSIYLVQNFGFLYSPYGKFIFLTFVGMVCYQLSTMGKVMFGLLILYGFVNLYVNFIHPKYPQYLRIMHFYNKVKAGKQSKDSGLA